MLGISRQGGLPALTDPDQAGGLSPRTLR